MSIDDLEIHEEARYLIGDAILRRIFKSERSPDTLEEIAIILRWLETWLDHDELWTVSVGTGLVLDLKPPPEPPRQPDDDDGIPF